MEEYEYERLSGDVPLLTVNRTLMHFIHDDMLVGVISCLSLSRL